MPKYKNNVYTEYVKTVKLLLLILLPRTIVIYSHYLENLNIPATAVHKSINLLLNNVTKAHLKKQGHTMTIKLNDFIIL